MLKKVGYYTRPPPAAPRRAPSQAGRSILLPVALAHDDIVRPENRDRIRNHIAA